MPADHVSRSPNDTYYVSPDTVLRCHTSAHQAELLRQGHRAFLVTGDVYRYACVEHCAARPSCRAQAPPCTPPSRRRDSIDATHYPVFHQMEGVRVFGPEDWQAAGMEATEFAEEELKRMLEGLAQHLFGEHAGRRVALVCPAAPMPAFV